jgi:hypothetical protein
MVNTLADNVYTMVDNRPIMLPEHGQEMCKHTTWPPPPASAPWPQTPLPRPRSQMPETYPLSGLEDLELVMLKLPRPVVASL